MAGDVQYQGVPLIDLPHDDLLALTTWLVLKMKALPKMPEMPNYGAKEDERDLAFLKEMFNK